METTPKNGAGKPNTSAETPAKKDGRPTRRRLVSPETDSLGAVTFIGGVANCVRPKKQPPTQQFSQHDIQVILQGYSQQFKHHAPRDLTHNASLPRLTSVAHQQALEALKAGQPVAEWEKAWQGSMEAQKRGLRTPSFEAVPVLPLVLSEPDQKLLDRLLQEMGHAEFTQAWESGAVEIDVNRSMALLLSGSRRLPGRYQVAHILWSWVWVLSIPAALAVMYFYAWWAGLLILVVLTPALSIAAKRSAAQFIIDYAVENPDFYRSSVRSGLLRVRRKFPKTDRSSHEPNLTKTAQNDVIDIGWDEGELSDGRPYRAECWAQDQVTVLTFFFSVSGLEEYSDQGFADFLRHEGLVIFLVEKPYVTAKTYIDAGGNKMWSVNVVIGDADELFARDSVGIRAYRQG